jgi:uncharacterized protein YndB with AHSA1/START domain
MLTKNKTNVIAEPGKQEVIVTREFEAPRHLVFKAFTSADLYAKWVGPRELTMRLEKFEPHSGGSWGYVLTDPGGNEYRFHGVTHELAAPERIIGTFEFDNLPEKGHVVMETVRFAELPGGRTKLTVQSVFQSVQDRDGMVAAGMENGLTASHQRLDELIEAGVLA